VQRRGAHYTDQFNSVNLNRLLHFLLLYRLQTPALLLQEGAHYIEQKETVNGIFNILLNIFELFISGRRKSDSTPQNRTMRARSNCFI